jgi:hypothetical protein
MKLIIPQLVDQISCLQKHDIAFPKIDFIDQELNRRQTTLKAAYTTINKSDYLSVYLNELTWDVKGDIEWQNTVLKSLSIKIFEMIDEYKSTNHLNDELLKKIFLYIQLWGGNESRGFFNNNGGFKNNYNSYKYKAAALKSLDGNPEGLIHFIGTNKHPELKIKQIGISFATKHMYFWSNKKLPIYDNIIAMIIFGRPTQNSYKHYLQYFDALNKVSSLTGVETYLIERSIFNWAETNSGKQWFEIRNRNK